MPLLAGAPAINACRETAIRTGWPARMIYRTMLAAISRPFALQQFQHGGRLLRRRPDIARVDADVAQLVIR